MMLTTKRPAATLVPGERVTVESIYNIFRNFQGRHESDTLTVQSVVHGALAPGSELPSMVQVTFAETPNLEDKNLTILFERRVQVEVVQEGVHLTPETLKEIVNLIGNKKDRPTKGSNKTTDRKGGSNEIIASIITRRSGIP